MYLCIGQNKLYRTSYCIQQSMSVSQQQQQQQQFYLQIHMIKGTCPAKSHKASRGGTRRERKHNGKKLQ